MKLLPSIKFLLGATLLSTSLSALAANDITGTWKCSAYDPISKATITTTGIIKKTGANTYSFKDWVNVKTGEKMKGAGVQSKNHDENFALTFWSDDKPGYIGFGVYQINIDGTLAGHKTTKGSELVAEEICTKVKS